MRQLHIVDIEGSGRTFHYLIPHAMTCCSVASFCEFLERPLSVIQSATDQLSPVDVHQHVTLRSLVLTPEHTLNRPVHFVHQAGEENPDAAIDLRQPVNTVILHRYTDVPYPEATKLNLTARNQQGYRYARILLDPIFDRVLDLQKTPIITRTGERITSFSPLPSLFLEEVATEEKIRFLYRVAQRLHQAPFENISKIDHTIPFRTGLEMWANIDQGYGGVCAEKTSALKSLCDILNIPNHPILGAQGGLPDDIEEQYLTYTRAGGHGETPPWVQHHLLEVTIDDKTLFIDTTNGNIPLSFRDNTDLEHLLAHGYRARMVYRVEHLQLRRASNILGDLLLTLSEYHVPDLYFNYIFDQGLGLHISKEMYIGVYFDWGGERSQTMEHYFTANALERRMPPPRFIRPEHLEYVPDTALQTMLEKIHTCLMHQRPDRHYTGSYTYVLQGLNPDFWAAPRISPSFQSMLQTSQPSTRIPAIA